MSGVLVVAEVRRGEVRDISFELIGSGAELSSAGAGPLTVALIAAGAADLAPALARAGVDEIVSVEAPCDHFDPHVVARALAVMIEQLGPSVILAGQSVDGAGFAPAVAAELELGFSSNVVSATWEGGALHARRGVYGDRLIADLVFDDRPAVLMVRAGAHAPAREVADVSVRSLDVPIESVPTEHLGFSEADSGGLDITKSSFLLSIGRGIGEQENVERFSELAERLGATLAASRPLIDAGWLPSARQVGQSGRTVKPKVYLALGISGAVQHLAGMRDADTIIAVNTDPEAPIFGVADYGAVVDVFEFAEALEKRLA
jgi:electron transfer flavoprotein alpha subunit